MEERGGLHGLFERSRHSRTGEESQDEEVYGSIYARGHDACGGFGPRNAPERPAAAGLRCDDSITGSFAPDALAKVVLVREFKKGDALGLAETALGMAPRANNDVCLVKLLVGPGNPGPTGKRSTSPGIFMEVWLPSQTNWNGRIRAHVRGGWIGDQRVGSLTHTANAAIGIPGVNAQIATDDGFVTVLTDGGHQDLSVNEPSAGRGMFAMNPDGTINTTLMADLSHRSTHEMAVKTKALVAAYYGRGATRSYLDGCSSGARAA